MSTRRTDSAPTTTMDLPTSKLPFDYFPETPSTLTGDLFSPSTVTRLAVLAGGISIRVRDKARQVLPRADIPSLLRDLRYTLIEHQYQTWIERNEVQPRGLHKPSYDKPKGPPKAPSPPPLTARTTHAGPQEEEATESRGHLVPQPTGLEAPTLLLDDHHRSTPILPPTRTDTTEATTHVPRRTTKATPTRPHRRTRRRRRINRNHDNLFFIFSTQHRLSPLFSHHTHDP